MIERPAVVVLLTFPDDADVLEFARSLVDERLAACVSVLPGVESVYRWDGVLQQSAERQLIVKTTEDRIESLRDRVHALHPYDTPEFLVLPVTAGSAPYLEWIGAAVRKGDR